MGKRSQIMRQKWIIKLMSDGEVWTNREIYDASVEHYKGGMKGFSSFRGCHSLLGQMGRSTNRRVSETHEVVKVGEGTLTLKDNPYRRDAQKYVEYILQERT